MLLDISYTNIDVYVSKLNATDRMAFLVGFTLTNHD